MQMRRPFTEGYIKYYKEYGLDLLVLSVMR